MKNRKTLWLGLWLFVVFTLCFGAWFSVSDKYKKETIYVKNEEEIVNDSQNDFSTLLPEADKMFEQAAIEKPYLIDEKYYGFNASNVTVSDYDCYVERAIEKGFKEFWSDDTGYLIWSGVNGKYKLSVIYDVETKIISISIYKEEYSNDHKQCLPV